MTKTIKPIHIGPDNKAYFARKYVEQIVHNMDCKDLMDTTRDYLYRDKMTEPDSILEEEIFKSFPELLQDYHLEKEAHNA